ncbi:MAG: hypothetical protein ACR2GY_05030 [Phycisphaerales bacterium]
MFKKTFRNILLATGLAVCLALPAIAADRITMKDGRTYVGEITSQTENVVRISVVYGNMAKEHIFFTGDIALIEKDVATDAPVATGTNSKSTPATTDAKAGHHPNNPGVIFLPLTGGVGQTFRHDEIEMAAKHADEIKKKTGFAPIIVLEIESGGGMMLEMYKIHDTLMEVKKRHRIVAWIKEAISAAAATAFHCDEIYFRTDGNLGAMTGFNSGTGQALQDEALQQWLSDAHAWAEAGGRFGGIAQAMIHNPYELSYSIDPDTGEVIWFSDLTGDVILSTGERNLSFTSSTALHSGFADGIADTTEELAELLDLPEWYEVDTYGRDIHRNWVETFELANHDIPRIYGELQIVQASAAAGNLEKIGRSIDLLQQLIRWWDRAPFVCEYLVGVPPKDQLERTIAELRRQAAMIRRAEAQQRNRGGGRGN